MMFGRFDADTEASLDFARCQRDNGSYYGIKNGTTCRKGRPVSDKEINTLKSAAKKGNKKAQLAIDVLENKKTKKQAAEELKKGGGGKTESKGGKKPKYDKALEEKFKKYPPSALEELKKWREQEGKPVQPELEAAIKANQKKDKSESTRKNEKKEPNEKKETLKKRGMSEEQVARVRAIANEELSKARSNIKDMEMEGIWAKMEMDFAKKRIKERLKEEGLTNKKREGGSDTAQKKTIEKQKADKVKKSSSKEETEAKIRDWANKMPASMFKDDAAKEKFIQDKTREALKKERIGDGSAIRNAQRERLKRDFAPVDGKLKLVDKDGKSDTKTADNINKGLDALRKTSPDAAAKVDALMKALEGNPVAILSQDEDGPSIWTGKARSAAAQAAGMNGQDGVAFIKSMAQRSPGGELGFAAMGEGIIVMTGGRDIPPGEVKNKAQANKALKSAAKGDPPNWTWGADGSSVFIHEAGHIMHQRAFPGKSRQQIAQETEADFKRLGIKAPTQYGNTNAFETTAELYTAYVYNGPQLKETMPQAYEWIDNMVQRAYNYQPV